MKENETKEIRSSNEQQMTPSHLRDEHEDRGSFFSTFFEGFTINARKKSHRWFDDFSVCAAEESRGPQHISLTLYFFVVILPFLIIIIGCLSFSLTHRRLLFEFLLGFFFSLATIFILFLSHVRPRLLCCLKIEIHKKNISSREKKTLTRR